MFPCFVNSLVGLDVNKLLAHLSWRGGNGEELEIPAEVSCVSGNRVCNVVIDRVRVQGTESYSSAGKQSVWQGGVRRRHRRSATKSRRIVVPLSIPARVSFPLTCVLHLTPNTFRRMCIHQSIRFSSWCKIKARFCSLLASRGERRHCIRETQPGCCCCCCTWLNPAVISVYLNP